MKKFIGLLVMFMMISANCLAMTFSQPIKVGRAGCLDQAPYPGVVIEGATFNDGTYYTKNGYKPTSESRKTFYKGTAYWGNGSDALYCRYDYENRTYDYDGKNNYIVSLGSAMRTIYRINTNEGITLYALHYRFHYNNYVIIGKRKDGTWVKYIDTTNINEKYFGKNLYYADAPIYEEISSNGNTLVIPYKIKKKNAELRLKWDDKAQWFGVEQVVY